MLSALLHCLGRTSKGESEGGAQGNVCISLLHALSELKASTLPLYEAARNLQR